METDTSFLSFGEQLRRTVGEKPGAIAVKFGTRTFNYEELFDRATRLAAFLAAQGVHPGDRVATLSPNRLETVEEVAAIALLGAVRVPLYSHNPVSVHVHMLRLTEASALIIDRAYWPDLAAESEQLSQLSLVLVHGGDSESSYDAALAGSAPADPETLVNADDVSIIRFSSGTTGLPKGIMHRQRPYAELGEAMARAAGGIHSHTIQIAAGPMSHVSGIFMWPVIARGGTVIVMPQFDPEAFIGDIEAGATFSLVVPTMLKALLDVPHLGDRDLSSLESLAYGGSPIDETTLRRAIASFGLVFNQSFGQSEVTPISALSSKYHDMSNPHLDLAVLRSAGRIVEGASVRIVDDDANDVVEGAVGEIAVKAPWSMSAIWGDPAATAARFLPDGSLLTRDMGSLRDGFLYLSDRKDDMIISGGYNIWPTELENALMEHPAVGEAAVIGVPHERWGETPVAIVRLRPGMQVEPGELIEWCRDELGSIKKPSQVIIRKNELPRSPIGKVLRRVLRDEYGE